jgi:NADPH:quinone reductase-like Zn-dependent oxidoreductase
MKAVRIHEFGGPDTLQYEEVQRPEPKRGQVLVRVRAAGVGVWESQMKTSCACWAQTSSSAGVRS